MSGNYCRATPKPAALIEALRSIGYDLPTAIADIVDNSIAAAARNIWITIHWAGANSWICILDDGDGMEQLEITDAMVPGTKSPLESRSARDLGRFGLGLKTASFSQSRCLTVVSGKYQSTINARTWDLDYVEQTNDWWLQKDVTEIAQPWADKIATLNKGTAVIWTKLDRLTGSTAVVDVPAHNRFNDSIDHVRQYLQLIFHQFLEDGALTININGDPILPWNPFFEGHPSTYKFPVEYIPFGQYNAHKISFRGFVLPHKDQLSEQQLRHGAGMNGWTAHQGFYVYRNKRLLVFGDWLRLGRPNPWSRDEQYKLARIRIDITNATDADWQLDVKKSKASPPAPIRPRLTELASLVRDSARSIFAHRGKYGPRKQGVNSIDIERPWVPGIRNGRRIYKVNREHALIKSLIANCGADLPNVDTLIRILEETVPVEQIWLDVADQKLERPNPYDDLEPATLYNDMKVAFKILMTAGINADTAKQQLRNLEPFSFYPKLIGEL